MPPIHPNKPVSLEAPFDCWRQRLPLMEKVREQDILDEQSSLSSPLVCVDAFYSLVLIAAAVKVTGFLLLLLLFPSLLGSRVYTFGSTLSSHCWMFHHSDPTRICFTPTLGMTYERRMYAQNKHTGGCEEHTPACAHTHGEKVSLGVFMILLESARLSVTGLRVKPSAPLMLPLCL